MERHIPQAEFARPDEVIHLAAGIQFSGFKSVVGTLWEVDDAVAKTRCSTSYCCRLVHIHMLSICDPLSFCYTNDPDAYFLHSRYSLFRIYCRVFVD
ncbi:hypothetical protein EV424DRAFT_1394948 [Suillus variegatus]|nr:hypothetical protein EV424DRAFT_1394948 [Suillus variegatus]